MNAEDDDAYVHDPAAFREDAADGDPANDDPGGDTGDADAAEGSGAAEPEGLGTRGRVLVVAVLVSFFVIPGIVLVRPPGLPFEVALLVFPLLPAVILGALAVWAMAGRS